MYAATSLGSAATVTVSLLSLSWITSPSGCVVTCQPSTYWLEKPRRAAGAARNTAFEGPWPGAVVRPLGAPGDYPGAPGAPVVGLGPAVRVAPQDPVAEGA